MNIIIYHLNKKIYLTELVTFERPSTNNIVATDNNVHWIKNITTTSPDTINVLVGSVKKTLRNICRDFKLIQAGGGIVSNHKKEVLFIYRNGYWDLPKGKLDVGETIEECAVREVCEETGLVSVKLGDLLYTSYHTYFHKNKWILKETFWYTMYTTDKHQLKPQVEEGITATKWATKAAMTRILNKTYPNLVDVIQRFLST
jgi:8-oxo-dGTP pyrophosphatase MutT (NUDIX family)